MQYPESTRVTLRLTPEQHKEYKRHSLTYLAAFRASLDKAIEGVI